ncbi:MAG: CotS family spore coat protein [Schaedlerella sp.]|nr:CotS family spore coat protein [Schaedlerella sp.]
MREYELEILEQYDIKVNNARKVRGAFYCDTNEGTMLLKETKMSDRRAPFFYEMLLELKESAGMNVELPVKNKEDSFISLSRDGSRYMLKRWFAGKECEVQKEKEVIRSVKELAVLHKKMRWSNEVTEGGISAGRHMKEEFLCHNREMKKVRAFIRSRPNKGKFEYLYLQYFEKMFHQAGQIISRLEESGYENLYRRSIAEKRLVHGDYNYHNILILPERIRENRGLYQDDDVVAVTGFEHFCVDVQVQDLYYFFRKVLEKHHWNERVGNTLLEAYNSIRPLSNDELEFIALRLAYPEKFWKTSSGYYRSNKAWTSERNVEKLSRSIVEMEEKMRLLKNQFQFTL